MDGGTGWRSPKLNGAGLPPECRLLKTAGGRALIRLCGAVAPKQLGFAISASLNGSAVQAFGIWTGEQLRVTARSFESEDIRITSGFQTAGAHSLERQLAGRWVLGRFDDSRVFAAALRCVAAGPAFHFIEVGRWRCRVAGHGNSDQLRCHTTPAEPLPDAPDIRRYISDGRKRSGRDGSTTFGSGGRLLRRLVGAETTSRAEAGTVPAIPDRRRDHSSPLPPDTVHSFHPGHYVLSMPFPSFHLFHHPLSIYFIYHCPLFNSPLLC